MGIKIKNMDWLKWIRKYSKGIKIKEKKTDSMETLIDSANSKIINYAYASSAIAEDEFINTATPPQQQRPMLPPPTTLQDSVSSPQQPNTDVYDCCVSLDGIPIKQEFQYTLSDGNGCGKVTKHDIEGLASKILESMYGTTSKFTPQSQRVVKVTLNVKPSNVAVTVRDNNMTPSPKRSHRSGRERKGKKSSVGKPYAKIMAATESEPVAYAEYLAGYPIYNDHGLPYYRIKPGAEWYRHDQLIEMVQRSLAENLSFQNPGESEKPEGHHKARTKRRHPNVYAADDAGAMPPPSPSSVAKPKTPAKVAWSPYDFEPVAYIPSNYQRQYHHKNVKNQQRMYNGYGGDDNYVVKPSGRQQQNHRAAVAAIVSGNFQQHQSKDRKDQVHTKNVDYQRYKNAKLWQKKIHHIHEHHHYHHYDHMV